MTESIARYHRLRPPSRESSSLDIAVGVPVHNSLGDVKLCLESVAATRPVGVHLIIVDDGSGQDTQRWLQEFAASHSDVELIRHDEPHGYTRAANVILRASSASATVLLNSDTVVPPAWVERLARCKESAPDIGVVGPLSNAASWQSVPDIYASGDRRDFAVNPLPVSWSVGDADLSAALTPSIIIPRVPLLNGFCQLIDRRVPDEIGYLDEVLFPRGYGEENDYAFRASDAGFGLAVADDCFVFHAKSRSFTHEGRRQLSSAGSKAFRGKWPKQRIDDAIKTMRDHPVLEEKRRLMRHAFDTSDPSDLHLVVDEAAGLGAMLAAMQKLGARVEYRDEGSSSKLSALRISDGRTPRIIREDFRVGDIVLLSNDAEPPAWAGDAVDLGQHPHEQARRLAILLRLSQIGGLVGESQPGHSQAVAGRRPTFVRSSRGRPIDRYDGPDSSFLRQFDPSRSVLDANRRLIEAFRARPEGDLSRVTWFVPEFTHVLRGGLRTIFGAALDLQINYGTENDFVLCGNALEDTGRTARHVNEHFPELDADFYSLRYSDDPSILPSSPTAVCTLWTTAYVLLRYNKCRAKFYFVQDWEPQFYAAGSTGALIEQTHRLGFMRLANSPGVADRCLAYDEWVGMFMPGVDTDLFHPSSTRAPGPPYRLVFYGRPKNRRNGFELGAEALKRVKSVLGPDIDIVSVGAEYDPAKLGLEGTLRNLGVLPTMEEVASLYRESHLGLVFMFTAHPSYQPLEWMASGCVTVTNFNVSNEWLLRDAYNCSLAYSTVSGVSDAILALVNDVDARRSIAGAGRSTVEDLPWSEAFAQIRSFLGDPVGHRYSGGATRTGQWGLGQA